MEMVLLIIHSNVAILLGHRKDKGFTLLEVMVSLSIIAIALTAMLWSQSQSVSLAGDAKFNTTAAFLARSKMAELETEEPENLSPGSGDFGENFPDYTWEVTLKEVPLDLPFHVSDDLKRIDLRVSWGEVNSYQYRLRLYRFVPRSP